MTKQKIRILEIRKDGVVDWRYVDVEAGLVDRRYRYDASALFHTYRYKLLGMGFVLVPSLLVGYGHHAPIHLPGRSSNPSPETINVVLERAIVALSDLFRRGQDRKLDMMLIMMIVVVLAVVYLLFNGGF